MPEFISKYLAFSLDTKARKLVAVGIVVTIVTLLLGVWIGYVSGHKAATTRCDIRGVLKTYCARNPTYPKGSEEANYFWRSLKNYRENVCIRKDLSCHSDRLPRNYIAYHLQGKTVSIDGQDDDDAWGEVPWSKTFVDMRAEYFTKPRYDTKFKMRWDDSKMYVLLYIQEQDLFATRTVRDTGVWLDNGIEMLMDVDGSMWYYKQVQLNVLGTILDLMMTKSPTHEGWQAANASMVWSAGIQHAISTSGTINDPTDKDKYWKAEFSLTWSSLAMNSSRTTQKPADNEAWFVQYGRSEWLLNVTNNTYTKAQSKGKWQAEDWWSWQPCGTINLHIQDRWGLVQFKKNRSDKKFLFTKWHMYRALFDTHDALMKYTAINGRLTDNIYELDVPSSLISRVCVEIPRINITRQPNDFVVNVTSRLLDNTVGHIKANKYVWFD